MPRTRKMMVVSPKSLWSRGKSVVKVFYGEDEPFRVMLIQAGEMRGFPEETQLGNRSSGPKLLPYQDF